MRTARAFRRLAPSWQYDSVTSTHTFYEIQTRYNALAVRNELWPAADVVHAHNQLTPYSRFTRRGAMRKPLVIHHHGTMYRIGYEKHLQEAAAWRATAIVSTLDLQAIAPDRTEWVPAAYSLDELASYRAARQDDGVLRVAHAPTNRPIKSTDALIAAVDKLKREGAAIELDVIEGVSNVECLRRKAQADVYVDQVLLGYGCNAVEAWGLGLPVIAGVDPELAPVRMRQRIPANTRDLMIETWGALPFYEASEASLYDALVAMMDAPLRAKWADIGAAHFERWHAESVVVAQLQRIYESALT